jgi:hypothetical protein
MARVKEADFQRTWHLTIRASQDQRARKSRAKGDMECAEDHGSLDAAVGQTWPVGGWSKAHPDECLTSGRKLGQRTLGGGTFTLAASPERWAIGSIISPGARSLKGHAAGKTVCQ